LSPNVSAYGSYAEGFKPQVPGNVDANDNPHFDPERSEQTEVGVKADLLDGRLSGTVAFYDIKKKNVLVGTGTTSPSGNPIAILSGLQQSKGVEVNVAYLPRPNWQIQAGYTYIDARVKTSATATIVGALLDNTPHNAASLWTRYNFTQERLKGLGVGFGWVYTGMRQAVVTNVAASRFQLPSYTRADIGLYYRKGRWDYALNVSNVSDRVYISGAMPGGADRINPGDPRRLSLSIRYDL
jgi:iron complex outermembrane receptor protein